MIIKSNYQDFPRKAKKAIKRNFMKTIDPAWKPREVHIQRLRLVRSFDKPDFKSWVVCDYGLY